MQNRESVPKLTVRTIQESLTEATDVETLYTASELQAQLELHAKQIRSQCTDDYEAKILDVEAKHAAKAIQLNQRRIEEKAELYAEIVSLKAQLKAALDAQMVKEELVNVVDELTFGYNVENDDADEKQKLRQDVADKGEKIIALTSTFAELVTRATNAERDKETAQNYYRQCRLRIEYLDNELRDLRAVLHSVTGPPGPATTTVISGPPTKIYVGKLSPTITEDALRQYFSQFGCAVNVAIIRSTARPLNYGFVHFSTPEEARNAMNWNVHNIDGLEFIVAPAHRLR
ncbi:hypothetical protein AAVH_24336 [Aphelenchoides avenae]|nr:hypothetical protein AAVH_24336 [Aphelenchus avenae]